jgi:hypothetical protein
MQDIMQPSSSIVGTIIVFVNQRLPAPPGLEKSYAGGDASEVGLLIVLITVGIAVLEMNDRIGLVVLKGVGDAVRGASDMGLPTPVTDGNVAGKLGIAGGGVQLIGNRHGLVGAEGDRVGTPAAVVVPTGAAVGGATLVPFTGTGIAFVPDGDREKKLSKGPNRKTATPPPPNTNNNNNKPSAIHRLFDSNEYNPLFVAAGGGCCCCCCCC